MPKRLFLLPVGWCVLMFFLPPQYKQQDGVIVESPGIVLGLDIGEARTGVARSDAMQMMAFPHEVVTASNIQEMTAKLAMLVRKMQPSLVVAGLPLNQHGTPGPQAAVVLQVVEAIAKETGVAIITQDERYSTAEAQRIVREAGRRKKGPKGRLDKIAATLILQTFLDKRALQRRNTS